MKTDGQLYNRESEAPPSLATAQCNRDVMRIDRDMLLILGIIILITSEKHRTDMPLILALVYILF